MLTIGSSKNIKENAVFEHKTKKPGLSANWSLNNWALKKWCKRSLTIQNCQYVAFPPFLLVIFLQHKTAPIGPTYKFKENKKTAGLLLW